MDNKEHNSELNPADDRNEPNEDNRTVGRTDAAEAVEPELTMNQWLRRNGILIVVATAILVWIYLNLGVTGFVFIAEVAIGIGLIIFIHELGHFLVAKWCGVKVEVFSIGFGPAIPGCRFQWGETTYKLAVFPLGGYVQMLGQVDLHEEDDETDNDPRSYKNKPVWQRMCIISAGVVMNVLLGLVCFVIVFLGPGQRRLAPVIPIIDSGSPSFPAGIRTGAVIDQIGENKKPYFNDLMLEVLWYHLINERVPMGWHQPGQEKHYVFLRPRHDKTQQRPMIGVSFPSSLQLSSAVGASQFDSPTLPKSVAFRAQPPFAFGDRIIATTDPENPAGPLKKLDIDKRVPKNDPHHGQRDYFQFIRRMQILAGERIVVRIERQTEGETELVDIKMEPAYHQTMGAVMAMGEITAVRKNSPNAAKIQLKQTEKNRKGDVIKLVEVSEPDGTITRFSTEPTKRRLAAVSPIVGAMFSPLAGRLAFLPDIVADKKQYREVRLDPTRLPYQLKQWAKRQKSKRQVYVHVRRQNLPKKNTREFSTNNKVLELVWEDSWRHDLVQPISAHAPMAIPELGIAYQIRTTVTWSDPNFKSESGDRLKEKDVIEKVRIWQYKNHEDKEPTVDKWYEYTDSKSETIEQKPNQWAQASWMLHSPNIAKVELVVNRQGEKVTLNIVPQEVKPNGETSEPGWPRWKRGLALERDWRLQEASGIFDAAAMGLRETWNKMSEIFMVLRGLATGKLGFSTIGGPVRIAGIAYRVAEYDIWELVFFLGVISINLAIVNFLPIPILDGGHMVFLTYELIRGKPASEQVRVGAMYAGLLMIVLLFVFVMYLDISWLFS